jgi:hypothetical protein
VSLTGRPAAVKKNELTPIGLPGYKGEAYSVDIAKLGRAVFNERIGD